MKGKENDIHIKTSKFLSFILRHSPQTINLNIDKNGWAEIDEVIQNANQFKKINLNIELIKKVVEINDKQRFLISDDGKRIRANQGHSIRIDLELENKTPPNILYHGTANRFLDEIMKSGLKPMTRQYVHLSATEETAFTVGERHGKPIVLCINAKDMHKDNYKFYLSENKVWLTEEVPAKYIS